MQALASEEGAGTLKDMVLFGNRSSFGIEVLVDHALRALPDAPTALSGRCCVWLHGVPVGDLDEWGCVLDTIRRELVDTAASLQHRWHPALAGLTAAQRFGRLDRLVFAAHRTRSLAEGLDAEARRELFAQIDREKEGWGIRSFLIHSSEAFDGWKAFLLVPPPGDLVQVVWCADADERAEVHEALVPTTGFRAVVDAFAVWFETAQARWRSD